MCSVGQADRGGGTRNFLHRHDVGKVAEVGTAVVIAGSDAEHAEVAELAPQLPGKFVVLSDLRGVRRDFLFGKDTHCVAQHVDILAEVEVESEH